jgi:FKBP-type peptidyl-prolyl cis-trans isomerase
MSADLTRGYIERGEVRLLMLIKRAILIKILYIQCMGKKQMFSQIRGTRLEDFEPVAVVEKLIKIDINVGQGKQCQTSSTVKAHYVGALCSTGLVFESSLDSGKPLMFRLDEVIEGWSVGLPGMKEGGKRRLVIPASIAYGQNSPSKDIPRNSDLVFDIELIKII